jgi:hypothetical protein
VGDNLAPLILSTLGSIQTQSSSFFIAFSITAEPNKPLCNINIGNILPFDDGLPVKIGQA